MSGLREAMKKGEVSFLSRPSLTIDALYRENKRELAQYDKEGMLTAEMEAAALFTVADVVGARAAAVFMVSDLLTEDGWTVSWKADALKISRVWPRWPRYSDSFSPASDITGNEGCRLMVSCTVDPNEVLKRSKVVAVVGASKNPEKEANAVPLYLMKHGYTVVPVNPAAGIIHGLKVYPSLAELPPELAARVEVVEVFRPSGELPEIARQVVDLKERTKKTLVFWAQLGLENEEAKRILKKGGVPYVMDLCMRTQHQLRGGVQ